MSVPRHRWRLSWPTIGVVAWALVFGACGGRDGSADLVSADLELDVAAEETPTSVDVGPPDDSGAETEVSAAGPCGLLGLSCPTGFFCRHVPMFDPVQVTTAYCQSETGDAVFVPAGPFWMGPNRATEEQWWGEYGWAELLGVEQVEIHTGAYAILRRAVTNAEYRACMEASASPCKAPTRAWPDYYYEPEPIYSPPIEDPAFADVPVREITWRDANTYCAWLGASTGSPWRLCSESEWEKAARGGCETLAAELAAGVGCRDAMRAYPWGNEPVQCGLAPLQLWYTCMKTYDNEPEPSDLFPGAMSAYGMLDAFGNVMQWVEDCGHESGLAGLDEVPRDGSAWVQDCEYSPSQHPKTGVDLPWLPAIRRILRGLGMWGTYNPVTELGMKEGSTTISRSILYYWDTQSWPSSGIRCCRSL